MEIIEHLLLAIHHSWNTMKSLGKNQRCNELCEVFVAYTLGRTSAEFRHRLDFGREESAFIELFNGPPPTAVTFSLADAGIDKFDKHGKRPGNLDEWTILSRHLKNEVDAFERDLEMTQDELDDDFQEFALIQSIPGNAYTTVANGLVSTKVIALVHIVIRFRLGRMLRVFEILWEYHVKDEAMQLPWHTGAPATPPPHTLQKELYNAVTNLTDLLVAYQHFLNKSDPKCKIYALPNVFPTQRISTHLLNDDIQQIQYEKSRADDDKYHYLRNLPWGYSIMAWLFSLCDHYHSAKNLIRFAKKVSRGELEKSRIVLKLLPKVPEVATDDIDILLVFTSAMDGPNAPVQLQEKYDRIAETLSNFSRDDEEFGSCVEDGFLSPVSFGARVFFEMINSTIPPSKREDMKPAPRPEIYKRKLRSHIRRTYPRIACNRAIPMVDAILLDELLIEYYGSIVYEKGIPHEHGIISGSKCWNKIFATALPDEVYDAIAERVLDKLRRYFRKRLAGMGVEDLKQWIGFAKGEVYQMPGVQEGESALALGGEEVIEGQEDEGDEAAGDLVGGEEMDIDLGDDIPDTAPQPIAVPVGSTEEENEWWAADVEKRIKWQTSGQAEDEAERIKR